MVALVTQLGISMLVCIFIGVFIGWFLSERLHIIILFPVMLILGILAGMRSCYGLIKRFADWDDHRKK